MFATPNPSDRQSDIRPFDSQGTKKLVEGMCAVLRQQWHVSEPLEVLAAATEHVLRHQGPDAAVDDVWRFVMEGH